MAQHCFLALFLWMGCAAAVWAETNSLLETRSTLEKWVETRQLISKTRGDWQSDKELLQQTVALYERELASLAEQMSKVTTNNFQAAKEMAEAEALRQSSNQAREQTAQFAGGMEARIKNFAPRLPLPLQELLKKDLARIPADSTSTKMLPAERMQVCVGVLNEIDKFNTALSVFSEKRKNDKGDEVSVQSLYVGLGAAYFVNDQGDFAGVGQPGTNGWEWTNKPEIAGTVADALKMYRNEKTARFVMLPVTVK